MPPLFFDLSCPVCFEDLHNANKHPILCAHVILHELGHCLLGHHYHVLTHEYQYHFRVNVFYADSLFERREEEEAELFAHIVSTRIIHHNRLIALLNPLINPGQVSKLTDMMKS
jgi:hypothetical protein